MVKSQCGEIDFKLTATQIMQFDSFERVKSLNRHDYKKDSGGFFNVTATFDSITSYPRGKYPTA